jgi:putative ABC transport system ATP-binding protein
MTVTVPPLLEARRLSKTYRQGKVTVEALSGVDLAIGAGEFVVIAGISGSGKSTLLHLLGGLDRPDQGEVRFAGADLAARTEAERTELRRRQIGFVFQAFNLVPVLSAYENVEYGLWLSGVAKAERRQRVEGALEAVGLAQRMSHRPDHLSGGERQRVALARALVQEPRVILADEPTASLDSRTAGEMLHLLLELNARHGATFVFATHDSALVAHAPRVLHLVDGRLVDDLDRR